MVKSIFDVIIVVESIFDVVVVVESRFDVVNVDVVECIRWRAFFI